MARPTFVTVASIIFGVVALGHAARLALALPITIGTMSIPAWLSWAGLLVAGALSAWGFLSRH